MLKYLILAFLAFSFGQTYSQNIAAQYDKSVFHLENGNAFVETHFSFDGRSLQFIANSNGKFEAQIEVNIQFKKDENVVVIGEDVAGGAGTNGEQDAWGGVLGVTKGLLKHFGRERIIDTPITETAIMGMASGAALTGLRPVAELMFVDFMGVCFDQILNQTAKFRYMFGGKAVTPLTIRTMYGGGLRAASQHSQCLYPMFTHVPGIKVVLPSNPYDAKGLLIQSIRDNDPVIFMEHKNLYDTSGDVPDESYSIPFGEANSVSYTHLTLPTKA